MPLLQHAFEDEQRGRVDKLQGFAAFPRAAHAHRHGAERARIAGAPRIERVVQHHAAADERPDEEIDEIGEFWSAAKSQFCAAGRRSVILDEDRKRESMGEIADQIGAKPCIKIFGWRTHFLDPVPQFKGEGNAKPGDAVAPGRFQRGCEGVDAVDGEAADFVRHRPAIGDVPPLANRAQKIHQNDFRAAPPDLEAEGENPVGGKAHRHGRLADTAAHPFALRDEAVFSSARMMTETVCAESPVRRAMSARASAPCLRTSARTSRSL